MNNFNKVSAEKIAARWPRSRRKVSKQGSFEELVWVLRGPAIQMRQNKCAFITEQDQSIIALHILLSPTVCIRSVIKCSMSTQ